MAANDFIVPGQQLLLGYGGPVQPTEAAADAPPTTLPHRPPAPFGTATICALLFVDENGNARLDAGEPPLGGGQVSIADVNGKLAAEFSTAVEYTTDGLPLSHCTADLQTGDYNVGAAVPPDYNPTTAMSIPVQIDPGDTRYVEFAAQPSGPSSTPAREAGLRSAPPLGLLRLASAGGRRRAGVLCGSPWAQVAQLEPQVTPWATGPQRKSPLSSAPSSVTTFSGRLE